MILVLLHVVFQIIYTLEGAHWLLLDAQFFLNLTVYLLLNTRTIQSYSLQYMGYNGHFYIEQRIKMSSHSVILVIYFYLYFMM